MFLSLNTVDIIKTFVNEVTKIDKDKVSVDLASGRYVVDARSLLGIFSLDLSKPVEAIINAENEDDKNHAISILSKFVA